MCSGRAMNYVSGFSMNKANPRHTSSALLQLLRDDCQFAKFYAMCAHVYLGLMKWKCANLLVGVGDSFSVAAATAFESAATANGINICTKANYDSGSSDMTAPIKQIMTNRCCLVTVLFGLGRDIAPLLMEARAQRYDGEWVINENIKNSLHTITRDLKRHLDEPSIHRLLRGMLKLSLQKGVQRFPKYATAAPIPNSNDTFSNISLQSPRVAAYLRNQSHEDPH